ncbi:MAG: sugar phosphate isomerase/epimerase family protein [Longimicrobiales bacterium]
MCSWSLRPRGVDELIERVQQTGLGAVQLALDPVRTGAMRLDNVKRRFDAAGINVLSGMVAMEGEDYSTLESIRRTGGVVSDATWRDNLSAAAENARIAQALSIHLVTFHAGFVPADDTSAQHGLLLDRLRQLADTFAAAGVKLALETGQETAPVMLALVRELESYDIGVNFDPANMILYGMDDPIAALDILAPYVRQIHAKDAIASQSPGEWGTEVVVGDGAVDWVALFRTLDAHDIHPDLIIEREAGEKRVEDVLAATVHIRHLRAAG